jgi:hypothetical protein
MTRSEQDTANMIAGAAVLCSLLLAAILFFST